MSDESSVAGKGAEIMLPPQGNPFKKDEPPKASKSVGTPAEGVPPAGLEEEPMDLTPEDIAARFPSTQDERNAVPVASGDAAASVETATSGDVATPGVVDSARPPVLNKAPRFDLEPTPSLETFAATPMDAAASPPMAATFEAPAEPIMVTESMAASETAATPVDSMAAPISESIPPIESAPTASAPTVGFQPYNPFASAPDAGAPSAPALGAPASEPAATREISPTVAPVSTPPAPPRQGSGSTAVSVDVDRPDEIDRLTGRGVTLDFVKTPVTEDEFILQMLITDERVDELWDRIEKAEKMAINDENTSPKQRSENLESLKIARNLLLGGKRNYEDATRYVVEVESNLIYGSRVHRWSYSHGILLLVYELVWLVLLVLGIVSGPNFAPNFATGGELLTREFVLTIMITMLSGGLGGVMKSIYSLTTHIIKRDFDRQHNLWYITSPIVGLGMGFFVVLVLSIGVPTIGGAAEGRTVYVFYVLAFLVGFQQNVALRLVERAIKLFFSGGEEKESEEKSS